MDEKKNEELESKQYIIVKLGSEQYGIDIQYVDNIVRMQRVTRVPKAQPYFKGVINIRGEVIPVMSLRIKFGLEPDEFKNATRILIIKIEPQAAIGMIVDEVKEVITLSADDIDKATSGNDEKSLYLSGVGKQPNGLVSLLNIPAVVVDRDSAT
ncbi:MAG: chemotaxis protein CheW [Lachnospiraceae bacterium]|nr:chemotaxis protein CheW [Lachnospiraceae bacterium]